jgi:translation initiation factor RLI1
MSNINYNKQRYIKLLKLKYLQKKVLTSTEETELNKYLYVLEETLDWETKDQYVDLLEQFLSGEINSFTFSIKFKGI